MSKKYQKSIFIGITDDDRPKATVAARRCPGAFPTYIKIYRITAGRARHFERILLDGARRKIDEAATAHGRDRQLLSTAIVDLLTTAVMVAETAWLAYGSKLSADVVNAKEIIHLFRVLSLYSIFDEEQKNEPASLRVPGYPGSTTQSSPKSWPFTKLSLD